jgi:hypothetical protein
MSCNKKLWSLGNDVVSIRQLLEKYYLLPENRGNPLKIILGNILDVVDDIRLECMETVADFIVREEPEKELPIDHKIRQAEHDLNFYKLMKMKGNDDAKPIEPNLHTWEIKVCCTPEQMTQIRKQIELIKVNYQFGLGIIKPRS